MTSADSLSPTADGGSFRQAGDVVDAWVVCAEAALPGAGYFYPPKPFAIEGVGYGVLPQLEGEAHGVVRAAPSKDDDGADFPDDVELLLLLALAA